MHEKLHLSKKPLYSGSDDITEKYDVVIYGSDQIWRKQNLGGVGFDKWYYGSRNVSADKKIVYAGSMGKIGTSASDDDYVKKMMPNFDMISVRESDLQAYLRSLAIESELVIDPVFLLTKEQWSDIKLSSHIKYHYILFYNLLNNSESERFAKKLGTLKNLPVIELNKRIIPRKGYKRRASVEEFIQLINDADVIVSNSFHGVAFSLIFHKEFYAIGMGERSNRVISLLECAGLGDRYLQENVDVANLNLMKEIKYQEVDDRINKYIESSKTYLNNSIG
jgi:polysaccharide pyruvyl transferase WcaK-like protein